MKRPALLNDATAAPPRHARTSGIAMGALRAPAVLGLAYAAAALTAFPDTYLGVLLLYGKPLLLLAPPGILVLLFTVALYRRHARPFAYMTWLGYERRVPLLATAVMLLLTVSAFTTFKTNIPAMVPFYADPVLARIDNAIHGGEVWRYAHRLPEVTGLVIDTLYSQIWFAVVLGNGFLAAIICERGDFLRYSVAKLAILVFDGTVLATLLSSVGPIFYHDFYGGTAFAALDETMRGNPYIRHVPLYADYLRASYNNKVAILGTGISAMPSMHVALSVLIAWYLTSLGRMVGAIGWLFALLMAFGSIYTGWHYAIDGYVAAITASAIWIAISRCYGRPLLAGRGPPRPIATEPVS